MLSFLGFWASLAGLLVSWELVLYSPARVFYWFGLCLVCSSFLVFLLTKNDPGWKKGLIDRLSFVLFCVGAFWWFLWLDLNVIKYIIPFVIWGSIVYFARDSRNMGIISKNEKLAIFFGGVFFWSAISFGLSTVLGWKLWQVLLIFLVSFAVLCWPAMRSVSENSLKKIKAYLLLILLAVEMFAVIAWLPFTEATLALILTIFVLFIYDLEKYYLNPELINRRIITRKIVIYLLFFCLALISTPWN